MARGGRGTTIGMNRDSIWPLLWRLTYLTAILAGGFWLYAGVYAVEGTLLLAPGKPERLVVSPHAASGLGRVMHLGVPPDLLRAQQPRLYARALDRDQLYAERQLPFSVTLEQVEVLETRPPRLVLQRKRGEDTAEWRAVAGAVVPWGNSGEARLRELRPWAGLLRTLSGAPTAALSLRRGSEPWTRGVFLFDGQWQSVAPDTGLLFRWFRTERLAREALPERLDPLFGGRWGAVDGAQVIWLASFKPGTGATLADDTEVTLLAYAENHEGGGPAIQVSLKRRDRVESVGWYRAGDTQSPVRLELGSRFSAQVLLHAWRDGAVLAATYRQGVRGEIVALNERAVLSAAQGPGFEIRLDGAMRTATPSTASDTVIPPWEISLETPEGEVILREGEMHPLPDGGQLRFRRLPVAPRVRYALRFSSDEAGAATRSLMLGDSTRWGDWLFRYTGEVTDPTQWVVIEARRSLWTPGNLAGPVIFALGCYGFVLARALIARRAAYPSSSSDLPDLPEAAAASAASSEAVDVDRADN